MLPGLDQIPIVSCKKRSRSTLCIYATSYLRRHASAACGRLKYRRYLRTRLLAIRHASLGSLPAVMVKKKLDKNDL